MSFKTIIATLTAPDKILHGKGSIGVLVLTIAIMLVSYALGLLPITTMILIGGWLAAISVEGTQWNDNKNAKAAGNPPPHEVSALDAFFSQLAPMLAAVALEVARAFKVLPDWAVFHWDKLPPWLS